MSMRPHGAYCDSGHCQPVVNQLFFHTQAPCGPPASIAPRDRPSVIRGVGACQWLVPVGLASVPSRPRGTAWHNSTARNQTTTHSASTLLTVRRQRASVSACPGHPCTHRGDTYVYPKLSMGFEGKHTAGRAPQPGAEVAEPQLRVGARHSSTCAGGTQRDAGKGEAGSQLLSGACHSLALDVVGA